MYALIAILTSSLAWSADCDGLDQTPVVPSFSDVAIGESVYPLTRGRWKLLREDLVACGADQPADDLRRWITRRQLSAWSTLGGWYTSPLIVGFAVSARINRTRFENDLSEWTYSPEISPSGHIEMPSTEARGVLQQSVVRRFSVAHLSAFKPLGYRRLIFKKRKTSELLGKCVALTRSRKLAMFLLFGSA